MKYLMNPSVPMAPVLGKLFLIYMQAMDHALGALLTQNSEQNYE